MLCSISCIDPEDYIKYSVEEYDELIAKRDEYALDASRFRQYSMDMKYVYLPKAKKCMELEIEEEYAEYEIQKSVDELF